MPKLNLGCGVAKREGYVNIDWDKSFDPDVTHDLNKFPYPFKDNFFDLIEAVHILEHLDRPFDVMKELHRVLKPGGTLIIKVPHFSRGFTHSEHAHGFDVTFPLYFRKNFSGSGFTGAEFTVNKLELHWFKREKLADRWVGEFTYLFPRIGFGKLSAWAIRTLDTIFSFFANLSPYFCSRIWCFWVGGFEEIEFEFVCVKSKQ